jgi:hypothetical protein
VTKRGSLASRLATLSNSSKTLSRVLTSAKAKKNGGEPKRRLGRLDVGHFLVADQTRQTIHPSNTPPTAAPKNEPTVCGLVGSFPFMKLFARTATATQKPPSKKLQREADLAISLIQ